MKKQILSILFLCLFLIIYSQNPVIVKEDRKWNFVSETAVSFGLGIGGNSAFGAELQTMFLPKLSAQLGAGIEGFSGGLNYHIYPSVRSPYFSFQAWQQGFATEYKASYAGAMFVYRADKLLQAGLGAGYRFHKNPAIEYDSKFILMFNLGLYFPL